MCMKYKSMTLEELDRRQQFINELIHRYNVALKDRRYNDFSDCTVLNASGKNSCTSIRHLGILIRREMKKLEDDLFKNGTSFI